MCWHTLTESAWYFWSFRRPGPDLVGFTDPWNRCNGTNKYLFFQVFQTSFSVSFWSVPHLCSKGLSICIAHAVNGIVVSGSREINVFTDLCEPWHQSMVTAFDRDIKDLLN